MSTPSLVILGLYMPDIPARVYREQRKVTGCDELTKAHFKDLVLIEAVVEHIDASFKMGEIGQPYILGDYPYHFQCAYDEALLSPDGTTVIERSMRCVKGEGPLRFVFYT